MDYSNQLESDGVVDTQLDQIQQKRPQIPSEPAYQDYQQNRNNLSNQQQVSSFTEDEIQNLKEIFDLFDKQQQGRISTADLETIMGSLNRDPNEVRELIENIDPNQNSVSFEEFIQLMQNVENRIVQSTGMPIEQNYANE